MQRLALPRKLRLVSLIADQTQKFTVVPVAALGSIRSLVIGCKQPDGRWESPVVIGEWTPTGIVPKATVGAGNLRFYTPITGIIVRNNGGSGNIYCKVTDDTGKVIFNETQYVESGADAIFPIMKGPNDPIYFDMPNRNYELTVEVGH